MKIYLTHSMKGKIFQLEHKVEKLQRRGNDFIVYLKNKNGTIYPTFLSDYGNNTAIFYKFSKRQKKIVQRNW